MILDAAINKPKFNEMAIAEAQIATVRETIGGKPFLVTMDRGYTAIPAFLRMIDSQTYFVARLKSSDSKRNNKPFPLMMKTYRSSSPKAIGITI